MTALSGEKTDCYGPGIASLLVDLVLPGAPAGRVATVLGIPAACPVPFLHAMPSVLDAGRNERGRWVGHDQPLDGLCLALAAAAPDAKPVTLSYLRRQLADTAKRPDGRPSYAAVGGGTNRDALSAHNWAKQYHGHTGHQRLGFLVRAVEAAVMSDLHGVELAPRREVETQGKPPEAVVREDPSTTPAGYLIVGPDGQPIDMSVSWALGLRDHRREGSVVEFRDARKARSDYRRRGRRLLADLGAWPWCCAPEGRLRKHWVHDPVYMDAITAWHEESIRESETAQRVARDALACLQELRL